jgi:hypothetical protein
VFLLQAAACVSGPTERSEAGLLSQQAALCWLGRIGQPKNNNTDEQKILADYMAPFSGQQWWTHTKSLRTASSDKPETTIS